jgi:hypothetical protein
MDPKSFSKPDQARDENLVSLEFAHWLESSEESKIILPAGSHFEKKPRAQKFGWEEEVFNDIQNSDTSRAAESLGSVLREISRDSNPENRIEEVEKIFAIASSLNIEASSEVLRMSTEFYSSLAARVAINHVDHRIKKMLKLSLETTSYSLMDSSQKAEVFNSLLEQSQNEEIRDEVLRFSR